MKKNKKNNLDFKTVAKIGKDLQHILINSDNMVALNKLLKTYKGKVDLIYIDPPYNTGKKMGKYKDSFGSHEEWKKFMVPRLELAKQLLSEKGTIWISIGEAEEAYLKIMCNEIFEEKNKVASIIWQCKYTVSNDKQGITSQTEYILVYAKNKDKVTFNNDPLRQEYIDHSYKNIDNDPRGPWRGGVQLYKKKNKKSYTVTSPTGKQWTMPWNYSESQWKNVLEKNNLLYWGADGNSCPVKKVFLSDTKGIGIKNLWLGEEVGYTADGGDLLEKMGFDRNDFLYPKPLSLIERVLKVASQKDFLIMDFFAGSGTTGHAVLTANKNDNGKRKFILITNNEDGICTNVTFPRLEKVIEGYEIKEKKGKKENKVKIQGTGGSLVFLENDED